MYTCRISRPSRCQWNFDWKGDDVFDFLALEELLAAVHHVRHLGGAQLLLLGTVVGLDELDAKRQTAHDLVREVDGRALVTGVVKS
jgi:hypothetical protein